MHKHCQVTGEAVPLVLISPVNPLHRHHYTSISTGENLNPFTHPTSLSRAVLGAGEVWQRQAGGGVLWRWMSDWPGSLLFRPCLGASYNERHLGRTGKDRRRVKEMLCILFSFNCFNPLMVNIAKSVKWEVKWEVKDCERWKRCLRADESRWEWKLGS